MSRMFLICMMLAVVSASAGPLPEAYQLIVKRNVFDNTRTPERPPSTRVETPKEEAPPAPKQTLQVVGVAIVDGAPAAILSGSADGMSGVFATGATVAGMTIAAIDLQGVTLTADDRKLRVPVGAAISGRVGEEWTTTTTVPAGPVATTKPPETTSPGTTSPPAAGGESDILKRMRERRQREMEQ